MEEDEILHCNKHTFVFALYIKGFKEHNPLDKVCIKCFFVEKSPFLPEEDRSFYCYFYYKQAKKDETEDLNLGDALTEESDPYF